MVMRKLHTSTTVFLLGACTLFNAKAHAEEPVSFIAVHTGSFRQYEFTQRYSDRFAARWILHDRDSRVRGRTENAHILANISQRGSASFWDYHPFENSFRITAGLLFHDHNFELTGYALTTREFDNTRATVRYLKASPYIGLGFGGRTGPQKKVSYSFDLGVFDHGIPDVSIDLPPTVGLSPGEARTTAEREAGLLRNELSENRLAPVLSFSLSWVF